MTIVTKVCYSRPESIVIKGMLNKTLFIYFVKDYTKDEAIKILINFWHKWGHTRERPLFIDAHLDVED